MAAHYKNVTKSEIEEFLFPQGFKQVNVPGTAELVYSRRMDHENLQLSLRVYSGIDPGGNSRDIGEDAMRVTLFLRTNEGKVVMLGGSKRVHRVQGWKNNLQKRIDNWRDNIPHRKCTCGSFLILRKSSRGKFYGCCRYPECVHTEPYAENIVGKI